MQFRSRAHLASFFIAFLLLAVSVGPANAQITYVTSANGVDTDEGSAILLRVAHEMAVETDQTLRANAPSQPLAGQRELSLSPGTYELRPFITPSMLSRPGVLVWVEHDAVPPHRACCKGATG